MKIHKYNAIQDIPVIEKNACLTGKWNQWRRLFIVQVDSQYQVFSLNMFQRFTATFLKIFQFNYFKMILGGKQVKVLGPKDLNPTAKKVSQHAPQPVSIPAPPTVPPSTQPAPIPPAPQQALAIPRGVSPENKREFETLYYAYAYDHTRDETRSYIRGLYRHNAIKLQELEIYLNWKIPAGPQPPPPHIPGLTPQEIQEFENRLYFVCSNNYRHDQQIAQDMREAFEFYPRPTRDKLEIYLNCKFPHLAPQPAPQPAVVPAPAAAPQQQPPQPAAVPAPAVPHGVQPAVVRPVIPGLSPEEIEEFETSYDVHAATYLGQNIRQHMQLTFQVFPRDKRAKLEIYLNWKLPQLAPQAAPQRAAPQPPPPAAAVAAPHFDELPSDTRPSRFVLIRNGLSQFNRDGDRFKSSCALMAAAYLAANKQATSQSIEEAINSPQNPAAEHLDLGDEHVAKYRHQGNRLEPTPADAAIPIYEHTIQDAEWVQFLQNRFDQLFNQTQGCLILKNSKTYCIRRVNNSSAIEFFDSHGYSQLTGKEGGFVAEFRDLKHLKAFLNKFKPFIPIPGGQVGYAVLFAKSVKA